MDKQDSPSEEIVIVGSRYGALALLKWLKDSGRDYLKARITRLSVKAGVLMATCDCPLKLLRTERCRCLRTWSINATTGTSGNWQRCR